MVRIKGLHQWFLTFHPLLWLYQPKWAKCPLILYPLLGHKSFAILLTITKRNQSSLSPSIFHLVRSFPLTTEMLVNATPEEAWDGAKMIRLAGFCTLPNQRKVSELIWGGWETHGLESRVVPKQASQEQPVSELERTQPGPAETPGWFLNTWHWRRICDH